MRGKEDNSRDYFFRGMVFLIGFGLSVAGGVSLIGYLNLLTTGNSFKDYLLFISKSPECYLLPIGIAMITSAVFTKDKKSEKE